MREGEAFLKSKWPWVLKTRAKVLAKSAAVRLPVTQEELAALRTTLAELNAKWAARVGEEGVAWKIKDVKSLWGCCHWRDRYIVYNSELARAPRELVEYVVVHEYAHFHRPRARFRIPQTHGRAVAGVERPASAPQRARLDVVRRYAGGWIRPRSGRLAVDRTQGRHAQLAAAILSSSACFNCPNSGASAGLSFQSMNVCWRSMKKRRVSVFSVIL